MSEQPLPEKIAKIAKVDKSAIKSQVQLEEIYNAQEAAAPDKVKFEKAAEKASQDWEYNKAKYVVDQLKPEETTPTSPIRPIDEVQKSEIKIDKFSEKSIDDLIVRATENKDILQKPIQSVDELLQALEAKVQNDPEAKKLLESTYKKIEATEGPLLVDKLIHIDTSLKAALNKSGVEVTGESIVPKGKNPLVQFLNYLTHSDDQLSKVIAQVNNLGMEKNKIEPERILALQIKMAFVQQEIEFFTNVLNKTVESIKTTMNVQI